VNRYLLDTHVLYRWLHNDRRLGRPARRRLAEAGCSVSVASLWEMVVKSTSGKLPLPEGSLAEAVEKQGFDLLSVSAAHVDASRRFERLIRDPFDRLLVATASHEAMLLLTQDSFILGLASETRLPVLDANA
jgi:PIN domain nuclease of toxin-antitoxin system